MSQHYARVLVLDYYVSGLLVNFYSRGLPRPSLEAAWCLPKGSEAVVHILGLRL